MLKIFLWLRYLGKKKIVFLSVAAVALSVALLIVVASLFTAFIKAFEQSAVETMGDIVVIPPVRFSQCRRFVDKVEQIHYVKAATALLSVQGLLHLGKGDVRAVEIWGIEPGKRAEVTNFRQSLRRQRNEQAAPSFEVPGLPDTLGGFVGIGVVAEPNDKTDEYAPDLLSAERVVGQKVVITTGSAEKTGDGSGRGFKRKTVQFAIADVVFSGIYDLDKRLVYLPIGRLQEILYPDEAGGGTASQIQIKLENEADEDFVLAQVRGLWQQFASEQLGWEQYPIEQTVITTAMRMQSQYVAELRKQMAVLLLIFGVVSGSVVLLIFCILYMIAVTRRKDIAVIKSCGAANSSVVLVFVGFGCYVGAIGAGVGVAIGYIVTRNINIIEEWIRIIFGLKLWKSSVYMFSKIPNEVNWFSAMVIALLAIAAAAAGALIPAIIAACTRPVNVLRYE